MYLNNWETKEDMISSFEGVYGVEYLTVEQIAKYDDVEVLLANYSTGSYDGYSFVLYRSKSDGKLYENHASHCSCYGLEQQWEPELCDFDSLKHRVTEGHLGDDFKDEIRKVIHELESAK